MQLQLTDDQKAFVQEGIKTGRFSDEEDAWREAMSLWESRERRRAEIMVAVDLADDSFARGEGRIISTREQAASLVDEVKQRGLLRLRAEQSSQ
jgi:Arc/MetJ-type ribon-helix-helix transcriptional regulator